MMAMDHLPIQASSVPCERVFSSSAETNTKKRNQLNPLMMEALQMLKFHLKKSRLDFTKGWLTLEKQMVTDEPDEEDKDPLVELLQGNFQNNLDEIMGCIDEDG